MALVESYWSADTSEPVLESTVGGVLRAAAAAAPDGLALTAGVADPGARRQWTYAELLAEAERAARSLVGRFEPGEHVAIWAHNIPERVILEYAIGLAGLVLVTVNPALRPDEVKYVLAQSKAAGLFHVDTYRDQSLAGIVETLAPELPDLRKVVSFSDWDEFIGAGDRAAALPDVSPDDPAQIQYTSGTTGFPKGA
jgi:acyl-CoA synthetase (AMP-forming)/AMP-acid ligase II